MAPWVRLSVNNSSYTMNFSPRGRLRADPGLRPPTRPSWRRSRRQLPKPKSSQHLLSSEQKKPKPTLQQKPKRLRLRLLHWRQRRRRVFFFISRQTHQYRRRRCNRARNSQEAFSFVLVQKRLRSWQSSQDSRRYMGVSAIMSSSKFY